jgi:ethanolamine utilization microcompartment shell protein EutS
VSRSRSSGLTLDAGALLALDHARKANLMQALLKDVWRRRGTLCIPAGVVAQAWRSYRQVRLAHLIKSSDVEIAIMNLEVARNIGVLCTASGHHDVIDVHVALCARERGHAVVTSDLDDIARVDPSLVIISV